MPDEEERTVIRDGREFKVTQLPDAAPPKNRSAKTRFHHGEVGKPGETGAFMPQGETKPKHRGRKRKGGKR